MALGHVYKITPSEAMRWRDGTNQEAFWDTTLLYTETEKNILDLKKLSLVHSIPLGYVPYLLDHNTTTWR